MTYLISKDFAFSASHRLHGLPPDHPCSRLHGHNYRVRVEIGAADVDATGFVVDYGDLAPVGQWIDATLDHRHLNDAMRVNPTAELLAATIATKVAEVLDDDRLTVAVGVSETPKTWAWSRP